MNAWGSTAASSVTNTDVISINNSVISQLAASDVRKHYIMTGSTWTIGGAEPPAAAAKFIPGVEGVDAAIAVGNQYIIVSTREKSLSSTATANPVDATGGGGLPFASGPTLTGHRLCEEANS